MRGQVFATRGEAEAAQRAEDEAAGLPREHAEEAGAVGFAIQYPGAAAERIRARGVRTEHVHELIARRDGGAFALLAEGAGASDLEEDAWLERPREGSRP